MTEQERNAKVREIRDTINEKGGNLDLLKELCTFITTVEVEDDSVIMPTLRAFMEIMELIGPEAE